MSETANTDSTTDVRPPVPDRNLPIERQNVSAGGSRQAAAGAPSAALALCAGLIVAVAYERMALHATPVDRALPLIALAVSFAAWLVRESAAFYGVELAIPLLIGWSIAVPDERFRLVGFGLIAAVTIAGALFGVERLLPSRAAGMALVIVTLLRWVGRESFEWRRELLIALGCVAVALAGRGRKFAIALATVAALVTPAVPVRTVAIPYIAAIVLWIAALPFALLDPDGTRRHNTVTETASVLVVALAVVLFPWSGVAARALPYFWRSRPAGERFILNYALVPGQTVAIDLPGGATSLIVSGANMLQFRGGTVVGRVDPGATPIRIGDVADWGYGRRDQFWKSRNSLPHDPAGVIRSYGYDSWIDGAGRVPVPAAAKRIRVTAARSLPSDARLQVEAIEAEQRR